MLNVIADIGKIVSSSSEGDLLEFLIPESTSHKYIVGIDFDLEHQSLKFDLLVEGTDEGLSKQKLKEYLYVPAEKGKRPQFSPTSDKLHYLVSQTIPNLCNFLSDDSQLKKQLKAVWDQFLLEVKEKTGKKSGYILNNAFLTKGEITFEHSPEKLKEAIAAYSKEIAKAIAEETKASGRETIYTICIDGAPVAKHEDYRRFLLRKNAESAFDGAIQQSCAICGHTGNVTQDTTRFAMKFYITDKINFASYFDEKNYFKAVALCQSCYQNIIIGEKWIGQHLRTRLGGFDVYVLPQVVWPDTNTNRVFSQLKTVKNEFNEIKNIRALREAEREAMRQAERRRVFEQNAFIWNFLFFRKAQSSFKILTLIKDVPPSRIMEITNVTNAVDDVRKRLAISDSLAFDLDQIYRLIPLRKRGADLQEYKKILQLYYCIFNGLSVEKSQLHRFYTQLACTHHFETYKLFQISKPEKVTPDYALMCDTLRWNLFLVFLRKLNLIEGESPMNTNEFDAYFPDGVKPVLVELKYNSAQQGLALLGYVIGVIAYAQDKKENLKNKPVLEKINYQGMSEEKVVRLFNDAFEKIRQYRRHIGYAERWWALAKKLYESGANEKLSSDERVFYILSGYSMNLLRAKPEQEQESENAAPAEFNSEGANE
ncbi:MAG: TIGR02556 family CRISPR-associated protein [bacterium]